MRCARLDRRLIAMDVLNGVSHLYDMCFAESVCTALRCRQKFGITFVRGKSVVAYQARGCKSEQCCYSAPKERRNYDHHDE